MATSKLLRVLVMFVIAAFLSLPAAIATRADDESPVSNAEAQAEVSCCGEGYVCTPVDLDVNDDVTDDVTHEADEFEDDDGPACHGIVTCTFFVGGHIIALPFRLLNAVFRVVI